MTEPSIWDDLHSQGLQWDQIATDSSINPDGLTGNAIRKRVQWWKRNQKLPLFPQFSQRIYNDYLVVETDNAIISSDWEIPDTNSRMARLTLALGVKYGIKNKIIAGDLVATDQDALTSIINTWKTEGDLTYEQTIGITRKTINTLGNIFERIYICEGNHDDKISRKTIGEIHLGMFLIDTKAEYSHYHYLWLKTSRGYAYISHTRNYNRNSAVLGKQLYNRSVAPDGNKPKFVILGHTHQSQSGYSDDGLAEIYGLGCMRDKDLTKYASQASTTFPVWNNSLLMILDGHCYPISLSSDLKFWLGNLAKEV